MIKLEPAYLFSAGFVGASAVRCWRGAGFAGVRLVRARLAGRPTYCLLAARPSSIG